MLFKYSLEYNLQNSCILFKWKKKSFLYYLPVFQAQSFQTATRLGSLKDHSENERWDLVNSYLN